MSTPAVSVDSTPALSEGQRLMYTFIAPSKTMADLRRNASWWIPWLLISVASLAFVFALDKKIGWGQVIETQIQSNPKAAERLERLAPEQRAKIAKQQEAGARYVSYAAPVTNLLLLSVVSGVLVGLFNFGFGARFTFRQMMSISAYSFLPIILSTLLSILVVWFVDPESFDVKFPIASSIGYFIPASMPFWKALLGAVDVFTLWTMFLLAVGVSQMSKVKKGTAFAAIFGVFLLLKLAGAAVGSM
jgi:Yip1 domain